VILLDTSVLSRAFRRRRPGSAEQAIRARLEALLESDASLGIPGIVLQETLSGIGSKKQLGSLEEHLLASFEVITATVADHLRAARIWNTCAAGGVNVTHVDCLIAASAIGGAHALFAMDDDYEAIARLTTLELYRAGA
jgi:predicted nucleic acid-binding protein